LLRRKTVQTDITLRGKRRRKSYSSMRGAGVVRETKNGSALPLMDREKETTGDVPTSQREKKRGDPRGQWVKG